MKRRDFLKISGAASVTSVLLPSNMFSAQEWVFRAGCEGIDDRILVLIQLKGGNDGVNTIVPIEQYDKYAALRPSIKIADTGAKSFMNLDSTLPLADQVGLHPILTELKDMYDNGDVSIIQGVGYPDQNRSHFKSLDLWTSGGDGRSENFNLLTGWMGRYLEAYKTPQTQTTYPLAIEVGSKKKSQGFHTPTGEHVSINLTDIDPSGYYTTVSELGNAPITNFPLTDHGDVLRYIQGLEESTQNFSQGITDAFNAGSNAYTYPDTDLSNQLKTVARLISGGCKSKIYLVNLDGFDTHDAQAETGDPLLGRHAELLQELSQGIDAFFKDLKAQTLDEMVIGATFSEFGRKIRENGNNGTDHGGIAPMFLFGTPVKGGVFGTNVNLDEADAFNNYQLTSIQHDYRAVFTSIIQDFMGANNDICDTTFYDNSALSGFTGLKINSLIESQYLVDPTCYGVLTSIEDESSLDFSLFPNPASDTVRVNLKNEYKGGISITDVFGRTLLQVPTISNQNYIDIDVTSLSPGNYIIKLDGASKKATHLTITR